MAFEQEPTRIPVSIGNIKINSNGISGLAKGNVYWFLEDSMILEPERIWSASARSERPLASDELTNLVKFWAPGIEVTISVPYTYSQGPVDKRIMVVRRDIVMTLEDATEPDEPYQAVCFQIRITMSDGPVVTRCGDLAPPSPPSNVRAS